MKNITSVYAKDNGITRLKDVLKSKDTVKLYKDDEQGSDVYSGLFDKRSWLDENRIWHVYPIAIQEFNEGGKQHADVYIICPLCGMVHRHGTEVNEDIPINKDFPINYINELHPRYEKTGHRVLHCGPYLRSPKKSNMNRGYIIEGITVLDVMTYMDITYDD